MTRNLKRENLIKLAKMEVNGFKVDIQNYIYNPSYGYDYPSLVKQTHEDEQRTYHISLSYFKHYDGIGEYRVRTYSVKKSTDSKWKIIDDAKDVIIEESNRFNMMRLQTLTSNYK